MRLCKGVLLGSQVDLAALRKVAAIRGLATHEVWEYSFFRLPVLIRELSPCALVLGYKVSIWRYSEAAQAGLGCRSVLGLGQSCLVSNQQDQILQYIRFMPALHTEILR